MASISNDPNGRKRIQFVAPDESRKTIRLGKIDRKSTESICRHVEALLGAKIGAQPIPRDTAVWLSSIATTLYDKLATAELIEARPEADNPNAFTLGAFIDAYLAQRDDLKPNTLASFRQARISLVKYFGEDRAIQRINAGEAEEWAAMLRKEYAPATVANFVKKARQLFGQACRKQMIKENPFESVRVPSQVNKSREEFITRETIARVINAAPNPEWRAIIGLARYAGLRTPSETLALKWTSIDWQRDRLTVFSPKLEHLPSGGFRTLPMVPKLRAILAGAFDAAEEGSIFVINRYRNGTQNLRTQFLRIIRNAGIEPWGKLFHNLRSSLETEWTQDIPLHVVAEWLGNTPKVATAHYLQVRDCDFERVLKSGAENGAREAQNAAQQATAAYRSDSRNRSETREIFDEMPVFAGNDGESEYAPQESNL